MSGYKRRKKNTRIPRKVYVIVCEGKKTERIYFEKYRTRYSNLSIKTPDSKYTDPKNLIKFAKKQINEENLIFDNGDAIWCVFDCDENENNDLTEACKIAGKDIRISFSNPNFELWYLLHFELYVTKLERSEVIQKLKKYIPKYKKNMNVYDLLINERPEAIINAKKLIKIHERNEIKQISVESNPSTQIYNLVEEILKLTEE
ncbi:MAG: hypothetical protein AEth_01675 [Candidatus Argoarchaeum ethanivorans]|uniref:RloB-like protein n=1 Tax=Candidatus Argoarchaeum ethanivorans TaxID=2608793 RepID=A0A8B3S254_9EURY|nr:MAG: hypothetical protein AEth_01675 [Candidatus Argoarchaeum ethanivorans]